MTDFALVVTLNLLILMFSVFSPYLISARLLPPAQPHIKGQPVMADWEGRVCLILGYMIGLPVLGICILAFAAFLWRDAR